MHRLANRHHQPGITEGTNLFDANSAAGESGLLVAQVTVERGREVGQGKDVEAEALDKILDLLDLDRLQADMRQEDQFVIVDLCAVGDKLLDDGFTGQRPATLEAAFVIGCVDVDQGKFDLSGDAADVITLGFGQTGGVQTDQARCRPSW